MRYLLDTHTFIWIQDDPGKLSTIVKALLADKAHTILLSHVSVLEMQIKIGIDY